MPKSEHRFSGFPHLDANFIWCPNQFLDQCVVAHDRGVVRLVGYVLLQTLRLLDRNGVPVEQDIAVSFKRIVEEAGVSRGAAGQSIALALKHRFITCVQTPIPKATGQPGRVGKYALVWHDAFTGKDDAFRGFYSGEGRRTQIPHSFFTEVLPNESLATIRVVAAVIRHTIGYSNQFGGRRSNAPLSYTKLQAYTNLSRPALARAIKDAIANGYIVIVEQGSFSLDSKHNKATSYSLKWLTAEHKEAIGSKSEPMKSNSTASVQKVNHDRFNKLTDIGSKSEPDDRFKKFSTSKEVTKETKKQQQKELGAVVDEVLQRSVGLLVEQGIASNTARSIALRVPADEIESQIRWLPHRDIRSNKAGFLIDACRKHYAEPENLKEARRVARSKQVEERRDALREVWQQQQLENRKRWQRHAYESTNDPQVKACIAFDSPAVECPHKFTLDEMAIELGLEPITDRALRPQASAA